MRKPKISIIVIYNNMQDTIEDCITSLLNQTFCNTEIICVNNGSEDKSSEIVRELTKDDERVIHINLPVKNDEAQAVMKVSDLASGDYIIAFDGSVILEESALEEKYNELIRFESFNLTVNKGCLYKKTYIDNALSVRDFAEKCIDDKLKQINLRLDNFENLIKEETEKCYRNSVENLNNNNYEIMNRCNSVEKLLYTEKNNIYNEFETLKQSNNSIIEEIKNNINYQNSQLYDYINSEINKKGTEVNKIYDEINTNYKYTEKITKEAKENSQDCLANGLKVMYEKINNLENDLLLKYEALQKYADVSLENFENKLKILTSGIQNAPKIYFNTDFEEKLNTLDLENNMNKNFEKMYKHINENNAKFFEELTKIYKEINSKISENAIETEKTIIDKLGKTK